MKSTKQLFKEELRRKQALKKRMMFFGVSAIVLSVTCLTSLMHVYG